MPTRPCTANCWPFSREPKASAICYINESELTQQSTRYGLMQFLASGTSKKMVGGSVVEVYMNECSQLQSRQGVTLKKIHSRYVRDSWR